MAAAVAHRGDQDLVELLAIARVEASRRPGSVVLRVAGRLVTLTAQDLQQLAAPAPQPSQVLEQLSDQVEQLGRAVARLQTFPELGVGTHILPIEELAALQARVDSLRAAVIDRA